MYKTPITETDLHAYIDDQLTLSRRREVEDYLDEHPETNIRFKQYRHMHQDLHRLYDPVLDEPLPVQLSWRGRFRVRAWRFAAVCAWLGLGTLIGWQMGSPTNVVVRSESTAQTHLVKPAAFAHEIYSAEIRHPVEVSAEQEQHLISWLSKRMQAPITAPDLNPAGFRLVGGRLLPSTNKMAAQLMYERDDGLRITLYTRFGAWDNDITSFRFMRADGVGVFYWIDGARGYALVGELDRRQLLDLSGMVYQQSKHGQAGSNRSNLPQSKRE